MITKGQSLLVRFLTWLIILTFLHSNFIWASDGQYLTTRSSVSRDCLAVYSQLPEILGESTIYYEGAEVYHKLEELGIDTLEEAIAYRERVIEILQKEGIIKGPEKLGWLPYPDETGKSACYVFNADGVLLRITRKGEVVDDKLHKLLSLILGSGEVKEIGDLCIEVLPAIQVKGIINSFIDKIKMEWHVSLLKSKALPKEGKAIRLRGGNLTEGEHEDYKKFIEELIRSGKGRARTLFRRRKALYQGEKDFEQDNTPGEFYDALRGLKDKLPDWFDVVILDDLERFVLPDVILHPGIKRGQAYISSGYLKLLSLVYGGLDENDKKELINIILEAFRHEVKHIELEASADIRGSLEESKVEEKAPSFRARELFRILYAWNKTDVYGDIKYFLRRLRENNNEFASYLYGYCRLSLYAHLKVALKLLGKEPENATRIDVVLAQYHLGYVLSHSEPESTYFKTALKYLREYNLIDIGPEAKSPYALYKFVRELVRRNNFIENYKPLPGMNIKARSLDQFDPWIKGDQNRAGDSVRLPMEGETTALPMSIDDAKGRIEKLTLNKDPKEDRKLKDGIIGRLRSNSNGQVIISNEDLKIMGESLVGKAGMETNAAGKGGRTRRKKFIRRALYIDIARACIPVPIGEENRTIIEIFLAQGTSVNDIYKGDGRLTENIPIGVYTSHLTEGEITRELKRLGYTLTKKSTVTSYWEYAGDPNVSPVQVVRVRKSHLFDMHTGDFYKNVSPSIPWEDYTWPDAHDSSFIDFITSGSAYEWVTEGYKYRFISNVDNRAAVFNPMLLAIMELTQCPLINEISRKPPGQKGGTVVKFKEGKVPRSLYLGHRKGLLEGWEIDKGFTDGLAQEQFDNYFPFFNTASFVQNIIQYTREAFLSPSATDEDVLKFLKQFHDVRDNLDEISRLKYLLLESRYRMLTQCWEKDSTYPALQPTNLVGLHTWLVDTLFVEVPEGPKAGSNTRFEPFKANIWNLVDQVEFIQELIRANTEETLLVDAKLEPRDAESPNKIAALNDLQGEFKKKPNITLGEVLKVLQFAVQGMRDSLERTLSKGIQRFTSQPIGLEKIDIVHEAIGRFERWKKERIGEGRSLTAEELENKIQELAAEYNLSRFSYTHFYYACGEEILADTPLDQTIGELFEKTEVTPDIIDEIIRICELSESDKIKFMKAVSPIFISIDRMNRNLQEGNTWDLIVVTTDNEKVKEYMERHFEELKGTVFPRNINILVIQRKAGTEDLDGTLGIVDEIKLKMGWRPVTGDIEFMQRYNSSIKEIDNVLINYQNRGVGDPYEILRAINQVSLGGINDVLRYIIEHQILRKDQKGRIYMQYNGKQISPMNLHLLFQEDNIPFNKLSGLERYLLMHILLSLMMKVLIIHAAGKGIRNYPLTAIYGTKALIPTPAVRSDKLLTHIDQIICQYHMIVDDTPGGTITVGACDQFWAVGRSVRGGNQTIQIFGTRVDFAEELISSGIAVKEKGGYKLAKKFKNDYYIAGKEMERLLKEGRLPLIAAMLSLGHIKASPDGVFHRRIENLDPTKFLMEFLEKGYVDVHWWNHRLTLATANVLEEEYAWAGNESLSLSLSYDVLDPFNMTEEEYVEERLKRDAGQYIEQLRINGDIGAFTTNEEIELLKKLYIDSHKNDLIAKFKHIWSSAQRLKERGITLGYLDARGFFRDTGNNPQLQKVFTQAQNEIVPKELLNIRNNIISSPDVEEAVRRGELEVSPGAIIINSRIKRGRIGSGAVVINSEIDSLYTEDGPIMVWNLKARDRSFSLTRGDLLCDIYDPSKDEFLRIYLPIIGPDVMARRFAILSNQPTLDRLVDLTKGFDPDVAIKAEGRYCRGEGVRVTSGRQNLGLINPSHHLEDIPSEIVDRDGVRISIGSIEKMVKDDVGIRFIRFVRELGLDPEIDPPTKIRDAIAKFMAELEGDINQHLLPGDIHTVKGLGSALFSLCKNLRPRKVYALTKEAAVRILRNYPPGKIIGELGYSSLDDFLSKEDPRTILTMAFLEEGGKYVSTVLEWIGKNIGPGDFQWQDIVLVPVESSKFTELKRKEWIYARDRLTGRILVSTLSKGVGGIYPKLGYFLRIAKAIISLEEYGKIWRSFAREDKGKFGSWLVNALVSYMRESKTYDLGDRWVFDAWIHERLLKRFTDMASGMPLPFKKRLILMCRGYGVCRLMPDGSFVTCSGLSWVRSSFKSTDDPYKPPSSATARVEQNMAAREFLTKLLEIVGRKVREDVIKEINARIIERMKVAGQNGDSADWFNMGNESNASASQYSHKIREEKEAVLMKAEIKDLGEVGEFRLQVPEEELGRLSEIIEEKDVNELMVKVRERIQKELDWVKAEYGPGIFGAGKEVWLVDNLGGWDSEIKEQKGGVAVLKDGRILMDIDSLRNRQVARDVSKHEFYESILELVEENPGVREVTSIYQNLLDFIELPTEEQMALIEFLENPNNGLDSTDYARLLRYIYENRIIGDELIALSISFVINTPRYGYLRESLKGIVAEDVKVAEEKLKLAMSIYEDLAKATTEWQTVIERTKQAEEKVWQKTQERGSSRVYKAIKKLKMAFSIVRYRGDGVVSRLSKNKYIRLDIDELQNNPGLIEWIKSIDKGEECPFVYYSTSKKDVNGFLERHKLRQGKVPKSAKVEDIITLIDPNKVNKDIPQGTLYLQMPYARTTIYLAIEVVMAGGKVALIKDSLVLSTIRSVYEALLDEPVTDEELEELFLRPKPIVKLTEALSVIHKALIEYEKSA